MWKFCLVLLACFGVFACSTPQPEPSKIGSAAAALEPGEAERGRSAQPGKPPSDQAEALAYFAGGCFWGVEHYLEAMPGVISVESGYMGGEVKSPSYEQVVGKKTGHLETVRVRYRPEQVSYAALSQRFFEIHDPTQADGQGPDLGPQYRSAVFFNSPKEKTVLEGHIRALKARGFGVVTELREGGTFWPAEDYHQNYYKKTGKQPYCHTRVRRFDEPRLDK